MTLALILIIAAAFALAIMLRLALSRSLQVSGGSGQTTQLRPMDVDAFRNLTDPAEDEYLRHRLPAAQFRRVRRARLRAMAAYVQIASGNAVVLLHVGQAVLASGDPRTLEAARQLVNEALLLRRNAALALARIYLALAWPGYALATGRVADHYDRLSRSAMLLGRLQNPALPVRLTVSP